MSKDSKKIYYTDIIERLNSMKPDKQKEGVKLLTQEMTTGKDVSRLLPHVIKCMSTNDLELKKLVYLYIINYSRIRPLEAILAVNYFKKDSSDSNLILLHKEIRIRISNLIAQIYEVWYCIHHPKWKGKLKLLQK